MASEIRVDKINSLSGVGTVTLSPTGVDIAGITTAATLRATTGIVTSLTAGSLTSLGAVSGTTGTFSGAVSGTTGTFSSAVSGTTGTFTSSLTINTTTDQMLNLNSTDNGGTYIGYQRSGTRTAYLGHGGTGGTFSLRNEIQDGYVTITGNDGGSYIDMISLATSSNGDATFSGNLIIPDKIVHSGDTDTAIRFSDADTISFETGGSTRAKITSTGNFELPNDNDYIKIGAGGDLQFVHSGSASFISNSTGFLEIQAPTITFENTSGTERARISSNGKLLVGTTGEAPYNTRLLTVGDTSFDDTAIEIRSSSTTGRLYFTDSASAGVGAYQGELTFDHTSGNNRMHTKIGGTTKISVTGDGLTFNGDTAAANALDDYEEGTFTPRLGGTSNSSTYYVTGSGWYRKIGRMVYTCVRFNSVDLDNNASGDVKIHNLPFTCNSPATATDSITSDASYFNVVFNTSYQYAWYASNGGTSWVGLVSRNNTSWDSWPVSDFHASGLYINFSGWYQTDS